MVKIRRSAAGPLSRGLAALAAGFFLAAPVIVALAVVQYEELKWPIAVAAASLECGAVLLSFGVMQWYGRSARRLRVAGFVLVVLTGIASVSFAFIVVPIALLAAPSLRNREPAGGRDGHRTVRGIQPGGQSPA